MKIKKILHVILACIFICISLVSCGNKENEINNSKDSNGNTGNIENADDTGNAGNTDNTDDAEKAPTDNEKKEIEFDFEKINAIISSSSAHEVIKSKMKENIDFLEQELNKIANNSTLTEQEKIFVFEDILHDFQDELQDYTENENKAQNQITDSMRIGENALIQILGDAIISGNENEINSVLDEILNSFLEIINSEPRLLTVLETLTYKIYEIIAEIDYIQYSIDCINNDDSLTIEEKDEAISALEEELYQYEKEKEKFEELRTITISKIQDLEIRKDSLIGGIFDAIQNAPVSDIESEFYYYAEALEICESDDDYKEATADFKEHINYVIQKNELCKKIAKELDNIRQEINESFSNKENNDTIEDLKDAVENSDARAQDKEDAKDWIDKNNQQIQDDILHNENMTEQEKNDALGDKYQDMKDQINQGMQEDQEQFDKDAGSFESSSNENFKEIGEALKENREDKLDNEADNLKQENNQSSNEAWDKNTSDMIEELDKILGDENISDEIKDIVSDYKDSLENTQQNKENGSISEEEAKEQVNGATDQFNQELKDFMQDHFCGQELGEEMIEILSRAQENLNKYLQ